MPSMGSLVNLTEPGEKISEVEDKSVETSPPKNTERKRE